MRTGRSDLDWEVISELVAKALRKALFKYKLHAHEELFEKTYIYILQYY